MVSECKSVEQRTFKVQIGIAIIVILFLTGVSFSYGIWSQQLEDRLEDLETLSSNVNLDVKELKVENNELKIELAKINTKLSGIESLLIDLRERLN